LLAARWWRELKREQRPWKDVLEHLSGAAPRLLSVVTSLSGALLVLGGAIPTDERRLAWLGRILPLAVIETAHFLARVVGAAMVILAWGLERRVRLAYQVRYGGDSPCTETAPRSLRAAVGISVVMLLFLLGRLLSRRAPSANESAEAHDRG
jgi:phosphatidylglycerol lysyltransferase